MVKNKNCLHDWKSLYYRKTLKNSKAKQGLFRLKNKLICIKCFKIGEIK